MSPPHTVEVQYNRLPRYKLAFRSQNRPESGYGFIALPPQSCRDTPNLVISSVLTT